MGERVNDEFFDRLHRSGEALMRRLAKRVQQSATQMRDWPIATVEALDPADRLAAEMVTRWLNHELNVTHREEFELAMSAMRDATVEYILTGDEAALRAASHAALERFSRQIGA